MAYPWLIMVWLILVNHGGMVHYCYEDGGRLYNDSERRSITILNDEHGRVDTVPFATI